MKICSVGFFVCQVNVQLFTQKFVVSLAHGKSSILFPSDRGFSFRVGSNKVFTIVLPCCSNCGIDHCRLFYTANFDYSSQKSELDADYVPMPIVHIDQDSDSDATMVQVSFGDRLGALIDTMKSLKDLGLDVVKGTVSTEGAVTQTKFLITRLETGRKVEDPDLLERIRLTIINNLLKYHPESSERLAMGEAFGIKAPEKKLDVDIATHIHVKDDGPTRSLLSIETADRPGLLLEVIKIVADTNVTVESAEIDTEGLVAKDKFHVSYRGAALNSTLSQVLINCLRYYLRRPESDEDSY
ncbi:hypothetical protein DCAR_0415070 [Daucus carota subsp. sativus]|uniref:ACT domain-containing protein ACR n=1 Tax=Daucus carota subsp. sativus TaxID=79200 RepID=A0AAF1AUD4_DAUCS|nr:hypothetical protein DCAR_0415070 [Daucus carota subsp. sativus]